MRHSSKLFWLFLFAIYATNSGNDECCQRKCLGADIYNYITTSRDATNLDCNSECVYEKHDEPNSRYCFKTGGEETPKCENVRERKNLMELTPKEKHDLIYALKEAKKAGTYNGPPITGVKDKNSSNFHAAYDAATSFHGYPGLCGGPGAEGAGTPNDPPGGCCIHGYSTFLPWHRLFMIQLEDSLRSNPKYANVTLPYWDWTAQNFTALPSLVRFSTIPDPTDSSTTIDNPFFHSAIPGAPALPENFKPVTKRSSQYLIDYTAGHCISGSKNCYKTTESWPGLSVLMDLTLTALEEREYESFEKLIEYPHNMVHNQLGFVEYPGRSISDCTNGGLCYNYTMQVTYYASYDPIFLPFHAMVDYQWAVYQALQEHRNISYKEDCHPGFNADLQPFSREEINGNKVTNSYPRGKEVVDYRKALLYKYDNLTLNGMTIPKLDEFLNKRNDQDRLFAGFSLPDIYIHRIEFQACLPNSSCYLMPPPVTKVFKTREVHPGIYKEPSLLYVEVTRYLPAFGLKPDQNLRFQIVSSSIPESITYNPVSIFRKAKTNKDQITIFWPESTNKLYAPFFKVRQARKSSLRFLLENGTQAVFQYKDREALDNCSPDNRTLVEKEIDVEENTEYFFQNPVTDCKEGNKIIIDRINTCTWGEFHSEPNGDASIGWQLDMSKYRDHGICMEPGTFLRLYWRRDFHAVLERTKTQFEQCSVADGNWTGKPAWNQTTFPDPKTTSGFSLDGKPDNTYYIICPIGGGSHCYQGMKLKIHVKPNCFY